MVTRGSGRVGRRGRDGRRGARRGSRTRVLFVSMAMLLVAGLIQVGPAAAQGSGSGSGGPSTDPYVSSVEASSPLGYWRLDDPVGSATAADSTTPGVSASFGSGAAPGQPGLPLSTPTTAVSGTGGSPVLTVSDPSYPTGASSRTLEVWVKTSDISDEPIVSLGGVTLSSDGSRHLRLDVGRSGPVDLTTAVDLTDGHWHLVDLVVDGANATVLLDGSEAGSEALGSVTGTDTLTLGGLAASYEELAVFGGVLPPSAVSAHWALGQGEATGCAATPTASYPAAVLADGPAGFWALGSPTGGGLPAVSDDLSGHCADGVITPSATDATPGALHDDPAGGIAGTGDDVEFIAPSTLLPDGNAARTVEAWVRLTGPGSVVDISYGGEDAVSDSGDGLGQSVTEPEVSASPGQVTVEGMAYSTPGLTAGSWHLVDVVEPGSASGNPGAVSIDGSTPQTQDTWESGNGDGPIPSLGPLEVVADGAAVQDLAVYPSAVNGARIGAHLAAGQGTGTVTTLSAGPSTVSPEEPVTLTARVATTGPTGGTPTGVVTFADDGTSLGTGQLDASGTATTTATLADGRHSLTASYTGGSGFDASVSASTTVDAVQAGDTTTALTTSTPSVVVGSSESLAVAVAPADGSGGVPSGTVTVDEGTTTVGTGTLDGSGDADVAVTTLGIGTHHLVASYGGGTGWSGSSSSPLTVTVVPAPVTVAVSLSTSNPVAPGTNPTVTATVTSAAHTGVPTGSVTFTVTGAQGSVYGPSAVIETESATLSATGTASTTILTMLPSDYEVTASYRGDAVFAVGASGETALDFGGSHPTSASLTVDPSTLTAGGSFHATISVTPTDSSSGDLGLPVRRTRRAGGRRLRRLGDPAVLPVRRLLGSALPRIGLPGPEGPRGRCTGGSRPSRIDGVLPGERHL